MPPSPTRFDAAIFDFDETMVNLERQHYDAYSDLCRSEGSIYTELPPEIRNTSGMRVIDEIEEMKRIFGWPDSLEELVATRASFFLRRLEADEIEPLPGVRKLIASLRGAGLLLAVTSSGMRDYIELLLARMGLADSFEKIVAGDQVTKPKPDPEPYLITARLLGVEPARSIVFEDSAVGVLSAKRAGMYCIAVRNRYPRRPQDLSPADRMVTTLEEVDAQDFA